MRHGVPGARGRDAAGEVEREQDERDRVDRHRRQTPTSGNCPAPATVRREITPMQNSIPTPRERRRGRARGSAARASARRRRRRARGRGRRPARWLTRSVWPRSAPSPGESAADGAASRSSPIRSVVFTPARPAGRQPRLDPGASAPATAAARCRAIVGQPRRALGAAPPRRPGPAARRPDRSRLFTRSQPSASQSDSEGGGARIGLDPLQARSERATALTPPGREALRPDHRDVRHSATGTGSAPTGPPRPPR